MTALDKVKEMLPEMSPGEKAQILQWLALDLGGVSPGIESTPGVLDGDACIIRTRIPVWLLVHAKRLGSSEADLLVAYPTLRAEDLANAWAYYASHMAEIDRQIDDHEMS